MTKFEDANVYASDEKREYTKAYGEHPADTMRYEEVQGYTRIYILRYSESRRETRWFEDARRYGGIPGEVRRCADTWGRCMELQGYMRRHEKIRRDTRSFEEIRGDARRYEEIQGHKRRCEEMQGDAQGIPGDARKCEEIQGGARGYEEMRGDTRRYAVIQVGARYNRILWLQGMSFG